MIGLLFSINPLFSHSPNEVSFSIYKEDTFILVDAEFPWSLRNAVFMYDSTLNNQSTFQDIQNSLFRYIEANLIIKAENEEILKLLKVTDKKGKSHHEEYQLVFEKKTIKSIRNTLLFNFSSKQKNFHVLDVNEQKTEFVLTKDNPEITFEAESSISYLWFLLGGIVLLLGLFFYKS